MYPGEYAQTQADKPAVIMATSGATLTFGELDRRANQLAHLLRASGVRRLDHIAILMENNPRMVECCSAAERTGVYYTCINSYLSPDEVAYIVNDCQARIVISSAAKRAVAVALPERCPHV